MTIRLSGAQVTRVREALTRFNENDSGEDGPLDRGGEGRHIPVEQLVEDILKVALLEENHDDNR